MWHFAFHCAAALQGEGLATCRARIKPHQPSFSKPYHLYWRSVIDSRLIVCVSVWTHSQGSFACLGQPSVDYEHYEDWLDDVDYILWKSKWRKRDWHRISQDASAYPALCLWRCIFWTLARSASPDRAAIHCHRKEKNLERWGGVMATSETEHDKMGCSANFDPGKRPK